MIIKLEDIKRKILFSAIRSKENTFVTFRGSDLVKECQELRVLGFFKHIDKDNLYVSKYKLTNKGQRIGEEINNV
jgi:hypothetical protein